MTTPCNEDQLLLYFDGELTALERTQVDQHLMTCTECQRLVQQWSAVRGYLKTAAPATDTAAFLDKVMRQITVPMRRPFFQQWWVPALELALAGMLLLSLKLTQPQRHHVPYVSARPNLAALMGLDQEGL